MKEWPRMSMRFTLEPSYIRNALGIPKRYVNVYIDETPPQGREQEEIMDELHSMAHNKNAALTLVVNGGNGTGKTFIGCGFVNTLGRLSVCMDKDGNQKDYCPRYVNEADLLNRTTGWGEKGRDWFGEYTNDCEYLVIDEVGMTQWTATDKRRMEQILNKRFSNGFKTILLTNLGLSELFELFGSQVRSRLSTGKALALTGPDLRHTSKSNGPLWYEDEEDYYE